MYRLHKLPETYTRYRFFVIIGLSVTFVTAALLSHPGYASTSNTRVDAWGTLEVSASDTNNIGGSGVDIYSNGASAFYTPNMANNCVTVGAACVTTGEKWQCVEMVNRLYLTKGWTTANWQGNGNELYANAPANLTKEANGSITGLSPGDVISVDVDSISEGHTNVVSSVNGTTVTFVNQNTGPVYSTGTLNNGTLSLGWTGYNVIGVIHHPGAGGGNPPAASPDMSLVINQSSGYQAIVSRGPNNSLYYYWESANGWNGPLGVGGAGSSYSAPSMVIGPNGYASIVTRGPNNALLYYWQNASGWNGPIAASGANSAYSAPSLAVGPTNLLTVATQGPGNSLYIFWLPANGSWAGPIGVGGASSNNSSPSLVVGSNNYGSVVTQGPSNSMYYYWQTVGGGWAGPLSIGAAGSTNASPSVVMRPGNYPNAAVQGPTNSLWYYWMQGNGNWTGPLGVGASNSTY